MYKRQDIPDGVLSQGNDLMLSHMLGRMGRVLTQAAAICISCCEEMDPILIQDLRCRFSNVFPVGPMGLVVAPLKGLDNHNCLGWLDKQSTNSVVYVAFGSTTTLDPVELVALAEALEASGLKFLWSLKDNLKVCINYLLNIQNCEMIGNILFQTINMHRLFAFNHQFF